MQTIFEAMGGTYRQEGDYLLPNVKAPVRTPLREITSTGEIEQSFRLD